MKDNFNKIIAIITTLLILLVSLFIYLNNLTDPHVTAFSVVGSAEEASFVGQRVQLSFNRPMDIAADMTKYIFIEPTTQYLTSWSGNTLNIIFKNSLNPNTQYKITISKDFKDSYGNILKKDNTYNFKTKKLKYVYIQNSLSAKDKIWKSEISGKDKELLMEEEEIKDFAINDDYLVALTQNGLLNDLVIKNLKTNTKKSLNLAKTKITGISMSPTSNQFLFISQKAEVNSGFLDPTSIAKISIYDLNESVYTEFNPKNLPFEVLNATFTKDGESIFFKASDGTYYLTGTKDESLISLGKYLSAGGINKDLNKIIFVNFDVLAIDKPSQFLIEFNSDRSTRNLTEGIDPVVDPAYFHNSDDVIYSEKFKDLEMTKGLYKIKIATSDGKFRDILKDESYSLELPKLSPDDRYVAVEKYEDIDLLTFDNTREFDFQSKPYSSTLLIYDITFGKVVQTIDNSINLQWLY